jgi:RNA polymerase sigma-70 factor (ECF subfamily)
MHVINAPLVESSAVLSDEQIVSRVLSGETAFFEALMRRHNQTLYRVARAIVGDESEAEDVMQQAYVNAFTKLDQFDARARFSTWLTRIAIHEALARARRRKRYTTFDSESSVAPRRLFQSPMPDPEHQAFAGELARLLESAIDRLSDGVREVFVLRQIEGMNTAEVADVLEVSEDVVKARLSRARAAIRRDLGDRADIVAPNAFRFLRPRCDRMVTTVLSRVQ